MTKREELREDGVGEGDGRGELMTEQEIAALVAERDAALAWGNALSEAHERVGIGGNHLASALINMLGAGDDTFPPYSTECCDGLAIIKDPIKYELWVAWKVGMLERDYIESLTPPVALSQLKDRERRIGAADELEELHRKVSAVAVQVEERESRTFSWSDAATVVFDRAAELRELRADRERLEQQLADLRAKLAARDWRRIEETEDDDGAELIVGYWFKGYFHRPDRRMTKREAVRRLGSDCYYLPQPEPPKGEGAGDGRLESPQR